MRAILIAILIGVGAGLTGCASSDAQRNPDEVSSIPWNRPERWEGQGPFGGMLQGQGGR